MGQNALPLLTCPKCKVGRFLVPSRRVQPDGTVRDDWMFVWCSNCQHEFGTSLDRLVEHARSVLAIR